MELRNLYTFLQVAATQNFTKAAQILGYSQSNVSMHIQQLEAEVGMPLFDRIGRKVSLTQYGQELLPYAQQIVAITTQMENLLRSEQEIEGTIRLGIVESLFETAFQTAITNYHRRFPKMKVELCVTGKAKLQEYLRDNQIDLACLIDEALPEHVWNCWYMQDAPIVLISNTRHRLTEKPVVTWEDLAEEDFVLMEGSASYSRKFYDMLVEHSLPVQPFLKLESASMACRLVEENNYLSVLPLYSVENSVEARRVKILPLTDFSITEHIQLVLYKNKVVTPQIRGALEELRKAVQIVSRSC